MTSHWNLPPNPMPHPAGSPYHHHMPPPPPPPVSSSMSGSGGGGGGGGSSSKSKYAHLGQYGVSIIISRASLPLLSCFVALFFAFCCQPDFEPF